MLAAYGIGMYSSIQEASKKMSRITDQYTPIEKNNQFYMKVYDRVYKFLFPKVQELVDEFTRITLSEEGAGN
jgi:ribulose kinase